MSCDRAIALDVDGTLVNSRGTLVACIRKALHDSWSKTHVILASGRPADGLMHVYHQIGKQGDFIALNGAVVGDSEGKIETLARPFSVSATRRILDACAHHKHQIRAIFAYSADQWRAYGSIPPIKKESAVTHCIANVCPNEKALFESKIIKVTIVCVNDVVSSELCDRLKKYLRRFCQVEQSIPRYIEITQIGVSKGRALTLLKRINNWSNIVSIGDGSNDISMFRAADISFAMPWANSMVKRAANHVIRNPGHKQLARLILANVGSCKLH